MERGTEGDGSPPPPPFVANCRLLKTLVLVTMLRRDDDNGIPLPTSLILFKDLPAQWLVRPVLSNSLDERENLLQGLRAANSFDDVSKRTEEAPCLSFDFVLPQ